MQNTSAWLTCPRFSILSFKGNIHDFSSYPLLLSTEVDFTIMPMNWAFDARWLKDNACSFPDTKQVRSLDDLCCFMLLLCLCGLFLSFQSLPVFYCSILPCVYILARCFCKYFFLSCQGLSRYSYSNELSSLFVFVYH